MSWPQALFEPRAVAVIGSASAGKIGYELIQQLVEGGFADVVAVNPKAAGAFGVPAVTSLTEVPAAMAVDLAIVASPAATVPAVLDDCGRAGVGAAVIITAGFSESGNHDLEAEMLRVAGKHGIRIIGPNCAGIVNTKHALFPTLETRPPAGEVAFISQSGALGGAVLSWAEEQGMGFSKFVSYGNAADLSEIDLLDYLREDEQTQAVALYIESVSDGRRFMEAARRLTAVKPLVVIKSGRSESGSRATLSHTGSMAGADAVYDAALAQCGAIRAAGVEEMFDLCRGFVDLPPVRGKRIAIVTNSGGPGVLATDAAETAGLEIVSPSKGLRARLKETLHPYCSLGNPIDLTVQGTEDDYRNALIEMLSEADAALAINVNTPYLDAAPLARGVVAAAKATGKPIAANFMAGKTVESALPILREGNVPSFATGERAVAVIAAIAKRSQQSLTAELTSNSAGRASLAKRERILSERSRGDFPASATNAPHSLNVESRSDSTGPESTLSTDAGKLPWERTPLEPEGMDWLEELGFPVIAHRFARSAEEAVAKAQDLANGGPVAMKLVSPQILHKTDMGGVLLNVSGAEAVDAAFDRLGTAAAGKDFRGVLVTPMITDSVEAIVGLAHDPQFGPVVAVGLGGVFTEVFRDVAFRVAPIDAAEAHTMIAELRGAAILRGVRGKTPRDLNALAELLAGISHLPFRFPEIAELDFNPVFLLEEGAAIADVRIIRRSTGPGADTEPTTKGETDR